MPNAQDADVAPTKRILMAGRTGSGKTAQIWTLPGKKFGYIFDPNALSTLKGCDIDYEVFAPDVLNMDATLKGFNKNPVTGKTYEGDRPPGKKREPTVYMNWVEDVNQRAESGFFARYDWLIFDSFTFITKAVMDRQLWVNNRYGDVEDLADYRIVGAKMADVFGTISALPINIYATAHFQSFQDEKTKKVEVQLMLPGKARAMLPLQFTDVWLAQASSTEKGTRKYEIRTVPEPRGLQDLRCSIRGLGIEEDVTISSFGPESARYGIGNLLSKQPKPGNIVNIGSKK